MSKNYIDVTKEWLEQATPNSHDIEDQLFFEYKGKKYFVDGKNVVLDYSEKEREVAEWLRNTFGGEIKMIPRVNYPEGIQTPDYLFRNEKWDLKLVVGNGLNVLDNAIKQKKKQADNFVYDLTTCTMSLKTIYYQLQRIYNNPKRNWVNIIILKKHNRLIKVYKRKS